MKISILIPHWKTAKMTAFTVSKILQHSAGHDLDIIIIDNNAGDRTIEYLNPFLKHLTIVEYPNGMLQSQGVAMDYVCRYLKTEYFICLESDCYPEDDGWLDYYEKLIKAGNDCAGSLLRLSGGSYIHPAGALYKKSVWLECKDYCDGIEYTYFPSMSMREGHACHLMVHNNVFDRLLENPDDFIELSSSYKPYSKSKAEDMAIKYLPATGPFHGGWGGRQESVKTYGQRTIDSETPFIIVNEKTKKIVNRLSYEPGQMFCYWMNAMGKKIFYIPTDVKWIDGKEGQQQEYTLNEAGVRHIWAVSAYHNYTPKGEEAVAKMKQTIPDLLYATMPEQYKIK